MSAPYWTARRLRELDARLGGRDRAVLGRVSELRFVTGSQLARLHFDGVPARTAREALRRQVRLGLLERLPRVVGGVRAGSSGYVYRLGPAGERLAGQTWRTHTPGTLFVAHALQVAELHTLLAEADRAGRIELDELAAEPACHRQFAGLGSQRVLKPDSFVRFGLGDYEWSWFIEVDRGTEGSRALLTKLRQYVEYQASGQEQADHDVFPKVLWTAPDEARAEAIRAGVERLPVAGRELFGVSLFKDAVDTLMSAAAVTHTQPDDLSGGVKCK
ncbi:MAG: replication-relaxation family protein [Actinobacteria bacterium]|nr:replication-relaxation family protein [Actinomycetota bacterium]